MNSKMKKRMVVVGGIIILMIILLLAFVAGGNNAKVITVADAVNTDYTDKKVQVTGAVVPNSYFVDSDGTLHFALQDEEHPDPSAILQASYSKGVSSTFGNGISAMCTGRIDDSGQLVCTELVTKCPSKYEKAENALSVPQLAGYGLETMVGKTVKVTGPILKLGNVTDDVRLTIGTDEGQGDSSADQTARKDQALQLEVVFSGALGDQMQEGSSVVITGALREDGRLLASDVSLAQ